MPLALPVFPGRSLARCRWIDLHTPNPRASIAANRISGKDTGGASGTQNTIHLFDVELDTSATPPPYFGLSPPEMVPRYNEYLTTANIDTEQLRTDLSDRIDERAELWGQNKNVAEQHGLPLVAYEGGQHLVPHLLRTRSEPGNVAPRWIELTSDDDGAVDQAFVELLRAFNNSESMGQLYQRLIDKWSEKGGSTLTFFYDIGGPSQFGYWGLKETFDHQDAAKFVTVKEFLK